MFSFSILQNANQNKIINFLTRKYNRSIQFQFSKFWKKSFISKAQINFLTIKKSFQKQGMLLSYFCIIKIVKQMCVDDYQYRHFSSIRDKICMRFIFINEWNDERIYPVNVAQFETNGAIPLCLILQHLASKGLNIHQFNYYLPQFDTIIDPEHPCSIKLEELLGLDSKEIFFKYQRKDKSNQSVEFDLSEIMDQKTKEELLKNNEKISCSKNIKGFQPGDKQKFKQRIKQMEAEGKQDLQDHSESSHGKKKIKDPQRIISEVLAKVKLWRLLYQQKHISLVEGAKIVGISKKSLDDYFLVVRIGQLLGFNYTTNLKRKMGDLRYYIKHEQNEFKGRLPKLISQFSVFKLVETPDLEEFLSEYEEMKKNHHNQMEIEHN